MPLEVIGPGFGRTGTMSLKNALEILGFGPCHHMEEVFKNPEQVPRSQPATARQSPAALHSPASHDRDDPSSRQGITQRPKSPPILPLAPES
jgi:hypothetical protein